MIIFFDEEKAYLSWLSRHRVGFVLDCFREPSRKRPVLHRATCPMVRYGQTKRTHWTTGSHFKCCADDATELEDWSRDQTWKIAGPCQLCRSSSGPRPAETPPDEVHLTRLEGRILSFVLEVAVGHLDDDQPAYALTVEAIAQCLGKSSAQLSAALHRLVGADLLSIDSLMPTEQVSADRTVLPTARAFKTLPFYRDADFSQIAAELRKIAPAKQ